MYVHMQAHADISNEFSRPVAADITEDRLVGKAGTLQLGAKRPFIELDLDGDGFSGGFVSQGDSVDAG